MDVKTIVIINDNKRFEEEIKKAISLGYEVAASNITAETIHTPSTSYLTNKIIYYALVIRK